MSRNRNRHRSPIQTAGVAEPDMVDDQSEEIEHPDTEERAPTLGDLKQYARQFDLGMLKQNQVMTLAKMALAQEDPYTFLDVQAVAMEDAINKGGGLPVFPVRAEDVDRLQPSVRAQCPNNPSHAAKISHHRGKTRFGICDSCGAQFQSEDGRTWKKS